MRTPQAPIKANFFLVGPSLPEAPLRPPVVEVPTLTVLFVTTPRPINEPNANNQNFLFRIAIDCTPSGLR